MTAGKDGYPQVLTFICIWLAVYLCCAAAIAYFYDFWHGGRIVDPFRDRTEQVEAVFQTAAFAVLSVSWVIWLALRRKRNRRILLLAALATEVSLVVYAVVGLLVDTSSWGIALHFIFRGAFFAEYNWMTFILEVGPVTSCSIALFLFLASKVGDQESLEVQA